MFNFFNKILNKIRLFHQNYGIMLLEPPVSTNFLDHSFDNLRNFLKMSYVCRVINGHSLNH